MKTPATITAGEIYWLPKADKMPQHIRDSLGTVNPGVFEHPIIVVAVSPSGQTAHCCTITSLRGETFESYHQGHRAQFRHNHIPIYPAPHHPDTGVQLRLESDESKFEKKSYVKIGGPNMFSLPRNALDCTCGVAKDQRLTSESMRLLEKVMIRESCSVSAGEIEDIKILPLSRTSSSSSSSEWETTRNAYGSRYHYKSKDAHGHALEKASWRSRDPSPTNTTTTITTTITATAPRSEVDDKDRLIMPKRPRATTATTTTAVSLPPSPFAAICRTRAKSESDKAQKASNNTFSGALPSPPPSPSPQPAASAASAAPVTATATPAAPVLAQVRVPITTTTAIQADAKDRATFPKLTQATTTIQVFTPFSPLFCAKAGCKRNMAPQVSTVARVC